MYPFQCNSSLFSVWVRLKVKEKKALVQSYGPNINTETALNVFQQQTEGNLTGDSLRDSKKNVDIA